LIEEAAQTGIKRLGISGGEVFLFIKPLENMINRAKQLNYEAVSMVTNGFWGRSPKSTRNVLNMLYRAGFRPPKDALTISAGEFHQEWIEPLRACNIIKDYHGTFGVPITVDFEITHGKDHLADEFLELAHAEGIEESQFKFRVRKLIANLGRGKDLSPGATTNKPIKTFGKCKAINRFVAQPDGRVVPCCGFNRFNDGIVLGDISKSSYQDIVDNANHNIVNRYLTHVPLHELHAELAQQFTMPDQFSSSCELCEAIFGIPEHVKHLESIAHKYLSAV
jgi:molybdenum cofactor biosynthesis enzyme MoaA